MLQDLAVAAYVHVDMSAIYTHDGRLSVSAFLATIVQKQLQSMSRARVEILRTMANDQAVADNGANVIYASLREMKYRGVNLVDTRRSATEELHQQVSLRSLICSLLLPCFC